MLDLLRHPFIGVHELRRNLTSLLGTLKEGGTEMVITQNGKPVAVLMAPEHYLELQQALEEFSDPAYLSALLQAKREIREGRGIPAQEVFTKKGL